MIDFSINFQNANLPLRNKIQANNNNYASRPSFCALDRDVVDISSKDSKNSNLIKTYTAQHPVIVTEVDAKSSNTEIGLNFGKDLINLVKSQNASVEEVQKLIKKHVKADNVIIHPMKDYRYPNGQPLKEGSNRAAITRPSFDQDGNITKIELFIPEVNYSDENSVLEFIDKTSHEVTHIAQFVNKSHKYTQHQELSQQGAFMNFVQKKLTDYFTDKGVVDASTELLKASGVKISSVNDYNKFMDSAGNITESQIGEYLKFGKDPHAQKQIINEIFDMLYSDMLNAMNYKNDPVIVNLMKKYGDYGGLKAVIKQICSQSFKDEQEAYMVGNAIRKEYNGISAPQTNNDLINILMGIYSKALA